MFIMAAGSGLVPAVALAIGSAAPPSTVVEVNERRELHNHAENALTETRYAVLYPQPRTPMQSKLAQCN